MNDPSLVAIKGQPTKALDDAVYDAATLLQVATAASAARSSCLISDGQNGPKFNTHKYDEVRAELLRQEIAVYSVATGSSYFERKFDRLGSYAHDTGGECISDVERDFCGFLFPHYRASAQSIHSVSFRLASARSTTTLEVRVRREGLNILTRKRYYDGTFAAAPPK